MPHQLGYLLHNEDTIKVIHEAWEHLGVGLYPNIKDRAVQVFGTAYTAIATIIDDTLLIILALLASLTIASCEALPKNIRR